MLNFALHTSQFRSLQLAEDTTAIHLAEMQTHLEGINEWLASLQRLAIVVDDDVKIDARQ